MMLYLAGIATAILAVYLGMVTFYIVIGFRHARACPFHGWRDLVLDALTWPQVFDLTIEDGCE